MITFFVLAIVIYVVNVAALIAIDAAERRELAEAGEQG